MIDRYFRRHVNPVVLNFIPHNNQIELMSDPEPVPGSGPEEGPEGVPGGTDPEPEPTEPIPGGGEEGPEGNPG
jgi:hypothetical protein